MRTIEPPTHTGHTYPCGLCNEFDVDVAGDLCSRCLGVAVSVCSRCGRGREQYGPCVHCETGR